MEKNASTVPTCDLKSVAGEQRHHQPGVFFWHPCFLQAVKKGNTRFVGQNPSQGINEISAFHYCYATYGNF
ncbi:hypothetical protein Hanom_Chr06g00547611 [Helianthus anomalus]